MIAMVIAEPITSITDIAVTVRLEDTISVMVCRPSSSLGSAHSTPPEGSPVEPPNASWSPFMGGVKHRRSLGQELADTGNGAVNIPHKIGASAHGGLEYHRYCY